jgi:biopolymer transport protein ExbB
VVLLSTTLWPLWTEPAFGYQGEGKPAENGGADQDPAAADPQDSTDPPPPERESFLSVVANANGLLFGPSLLLMSFIMVALVVMNTLQMRRSILLPEEFVESFGERLTAKDYQGAYDLARNDDSFVARVLAAGLSKLNRGYSEAIEGMQEVGEEENMVLDHKVNYLALIGSIAPMIGLMGTVWGMIGAFEDIATSPTQPKPKDLAQNIYTALFTTLEGLMIAVPAIVACSLLRNQVSRIVLEIGIVSEGLMGRFSAVGRSGAGSPAVSTAAAQADDSGTKP